MMILSGRDVAKHRKAQLKDKISRLKQQQGVAPGLAVLLVGDDPASQVYVRNKVKSCQEVGMVSYEFRLSSSTPADELKRQIVK